MHNLTLLGVVSLNDPPRIGVDTAVNVCRAAGIKVIMVTGDQPLTAAAIAAKVNIITQPETEYTNLIKKKKMSEADAWEQCTGVVVHGDLLAQKHLSEENMDDLDPEKGRYLLEWIGKKEVVFARTTPSQKLLIVDACQRLGHIVAVTGDGVNDSPAIKKADIGIAMGSGSDVAKGAADMLLLDDNFCSIVNGVEEGRLIFDNLKKSIQYTIQHNVPEIVPFILFIVIQIPIPLSTVLILTIDLGMDMMPAIAFAYENAELDIMERFPRNSKYDHLVNGKLICYAYAQNGLVEAGAAMYTYFVAFNDFGFRPWMLIGIGLQSAILPKPGDVYNPNIEITAANGTLTNRYGNSNVATNDTVSIAWDLTAHAKVDLRLAYATVYDESAWTKCRWAPDDSSIPSFMRYSGITEYPICYSTEALKYAQSAYLIAVVTVQAAGNLAAKARKLSLYQQQFKNDVGAWGIFYSFALVAFIVYVPFMNVGLGSRQIPLQHATFPAYNFFIAIFFYAEARKIFYRRQSFFADGRVQHGGWLYKNCHW